MREYYLKNKKNILIQKIKYREDNKNIINKKAKEYYLKNKDLILDKNKKYWDKNKPKLLESGRIRGKIWYKDNKDKHNQQGFKWEKEKRIADPTYKIKQNLRRRLRYCLNNYGDGKEFKSKSYGVDYKKIIQHLKPFPKNMQNYHVDHIKPLCSFDLTDPIQIRTAFAPENHQWLLATDNLRKGGKTKWAE